VKNAENGKKRAPSSELHKRVGESRNLLHGRGLSMVEPIRCKSTCALFRVPAHFPQSISKFAVTPSSVFTPNLRGFPAIVTSY
jgi:hypothetical protein